MDSVPSKLSERMALSDALRVADILEADDVISVVAMSARRLAAEVRSLEQQLSLLKMEKVNHG